MKKRLIISATLASSVLFWTACGSSSDSATTGTAYYIDSAVEGVKATCGKTVTTTNALGAFTFEEGKNCTFSLGDILLREVDASLLADGAEVKETNINIARILQAMDIDGNPDNGITINTNILDALTKEGITTLPTTEAEMNVIMAVIASNGGREVSVAAAQKHLNSGQGVASTDTESTAIPKCYISEGTPKTETGITVHAVCKGGNTPIDAAHISMNGIEKNIDISGTGINDYLGYGDLKANTEYTVTFSVEVGGKTIEESVTIKTKEKKLSIRDMLAGKTVYSSGGYAFDGFSESAMSEVKFNTEMTSITYSDGYIAGFTFSNDTITYDSGYTLTLTLNGKYINANASYGGDLSLMRYYTSKSDAIADIANQIQALKTLLVGKTLYYAKYDVDAGKYISTEHTFTANEIIGEMFAFADYTKGKTVIYYGNGSLKIPYYFNSADVEL